MNRFFSIFSLVSMLLFGNCSSETVDSLPPEETPVETSIYFPPLNSDTWETTAVSELNWNENELQPLLDYLEEKNTKSFIILHKGKNFVESYMNGHTETSPCYWASAGKT